MYGYFIVMGSFGVMIMLGWRYRIAAIGYFLLWSGAYLMQKTNYNNHYYLMVLFTFILIFLPANRAFSLDAKRDPSIASNTCPRGIIWFFIFQSFIFYTYASIAKWNPDWLAYNSVAQLFAGKYDYPLIGPLLEQQWLQMFISWGGIVFDFLVVPALLWKPTRKWALFAALFFHLFNSVVFGIGVFPYMALGLILFFYNGKELRAFFNRRWSIIRPATEHHEIQRREGIRSVYFYGFIIWFVIQLLLPLRHHLIEGDVNWTEEGHRMSWRMMLRVKTGTLNFKVVDKQSGEVFFIRPKDYVTWKQSLRVISRPDFCWQFVQIIKEKYPNRDISIYALGKVSLNGGDYHPLFKEDVDLAKVEWDPWRHADWIWPYAGADKEAARESGESKEHQPG
jgi:hypothetical protein